MRVNGNHSEAVRFDGVTLTIRIPMRFQRHGGRKLIIAPEGEEDWAPAAPRSDNTLIRALARAHRWKRLIENGTYCSIKELAAAEKVNDSYVCRILRLTLLAPDIVDVILNGRQPKILQLKDLMRHVPTEWAKQRRALGFRT